MSFSVSENKAIKYNYFYISPIKPALAHNSIVEIDAESLNIGTRMVEGHVCWVEWLVKYDEGLCCACLNYRTGVTRVILKVIY